MLMTLIHSIDIRNYDYETRISFAQEVSNDIKFAEDDQNLTNAMLIGDFNMNPYERGMNLAAGLNAMMTRSCVAKGNRHHLGKDFPFYYNPMWSLFGDNSKGPPGTVYDTSNQGPYGWSMLDQVLLHHSAVPLFHDVEILTNAGSLSLMDSKGRPDKTKFSDHFPILASFYGDNNE